MRDVRSSELGDLQRAARILLGHGIVTEKRVGEREWRNLRRYAAPLAASFSDLAGYRVEVSRTSVALIRRIDKLSDSPVFRTPSDRAFDRMRYALVALVLAALERLGKQTTLTDLATRVRTAAAAIPNLPFDPDQHHARLALGHAVRVLEELGAVQLTDGSREAWEKSDGGGEALYDIDRTVCRRLFPVAVRRADDQPQFLHQDRVDLGRDPTRRARRQHLVRRLLEQPVVYFQDLGDDERAYLKREAGKLGATLEELTGGLLERRREGLALIDPGRRFSDVPFPAGGAGNQAALLLAAQLCALASTAPATPPPTLPLLAAPHSDEVSDELAARIAVALGGQAATPLRARQQRPFVAQRTLREVATTLVAELRANLTKQHAAHPGPFLRDALIVLTAHDLVRSVPGGIVLMPALARFREVRIQTAAAHVDQLTLGF